MSVQAVESCTFSQCGSTTLANAALRLVRDFIVSDNQALESYIRSTLGFEQPADSIVAGRTSWVTVAATGLKDPEDLQQQCSPSTSPSQGGESFVSESTHSTLSPLSNSRLGISSTSVDIPVDIPLGERRQLSSTAAAATTPVSSSAGRSRTAPRYRRPGLVEEFLEDEDTSEDEEVVTRHRHRTGARRAVASGECYRCDARETPQWRYVHKFRFCNACYMRVKRHTEQSRPGTRVPPRYKPFLDPAEDQRLQTLAQDLIDRAFDNE
ncbi:GATA zinc finger protein [Gregarina niphandrodes]|uniref:GATA zinc finger protein n=1 Tax=Gregarina niphandrodes TaxID=110365 RepID=A0A023BAA2_GRENI|nr:GATA zinc finger protein [Gregarina niphandrodes]EZG77884.1 GATA zinc finger protein [Gregarina niphandrodes]|eukprot:XP_011129476.1 GATA zinc finger protein [Gregarina niphandrodes]